MTWLTWATRLLSLWTGDAHSTMSQAGAKVELIRQDSALDRKSPPAEDLRVMPRFLTKFERAQVIAVRAMQIEQGAPPLVELNGETDPVAIARKELTARKLPITVRRYFPDSEQFEDWDVSELAILS
jgi:DNA-directed RNA polymerase subunit K/omega